MNLMVLLLVPRAHSIAYGKRYYIRNTAPYFYFASKNGISVIRE